jgi:O-antigen/teichoic acid export membrane protein
MIYTEQEKQKNSRIYNKDLTRRQVEINNWYYENKRETLFLLQFVLLTVLSIVIVLYMSHVGWLTQDAADFVMWFIIVVGAGLWLYRWYYTNYIRDPRYWNQRRRFDDGKFQLSGQICIGTDVGAVPKAKV